MPRINEAQISLARIQCVMVAQIPGDKYIHVPGHIAHFPAATSAHHAHSAYHFSGGAHYPHMRQTQCLANLCREGIQGKGLGQLAPYAQAQGGEGGIQGNNINGWFFIRMRGAQR